MRRKERWGDREMEIHKERKQTNKQTKKQTSSQEDRKVAK